MNKAKILLSALGILALIGSALAFKANKAYLGNLRCSTFTTTRTTAVIFNCPAVTYTTTLNPNQVRFCTRIDAPANSPCPAMWVTFHP